MDTFGRTFEDLTGHPPLCWQTRLYSEHFVKGQLPSAVDVPTGLGKTSVMALWLLARAHGAVLPRRLVYVVDRRVVVDQASDFARRLRKNVQFSPLLNQSLGLDGRALPISTLRGQFVDNREWLEDPASPAIVVGTVDMIGSRLLFEGYGVSKKMRPYHAGFLGIDTLVVLDESHLVPPFEALLSTIEGDEKQFRPASPTLSAILPRFQLLSLSATGAERPGKTFAFGEADLQGDQLARMRVTAEKKIVVQDSSESLETDLAHQAMELAQNSACRMLIFCDSRESAQTVRNDLVGRGAEVELLVGARRVQEREHLKEWLSHWGFLAGSMTAGSKSAFLVATAAGEVGIDLDADHMVCDLVPWERMVQRLGRVNRRGGKDRPAQVRVVPKKELDEKLSAARALLTEELPRLEDGTRDGSPLALRALKLRPDLRKVLELASSKPLTRPELNRALVDAWSLTSLAAENPARPEITPWIRGWDPNDKPQTTVVWRTYLPIRKGQPDRISKRLKAEIDKFFDAAAVHLSEQLETETSRVITWLFKRMLDVAPKMPPHEVAAYVLDHARELRFSRAEGKGARKLTHLRWSDFINLDKEQEKSLKEELASWFAGATLVVDAQIGGLSHGLLDDRSAVVPDTADACDNQEWGRTSGFRVSRVDDLSSQPGKLAYSFITRTSEDGTPTEWLAVEKTALDSPTEEERSLSPRYQTLADHQLLAHRIAQEVAAKLGLPTEYRQMLCVAASLHDEGKRAGIWQLAFRAKSDDDYAKTPGPIDFDVLGGYRHEFGSLPALEKSPHWQSLPEDLRELALHIVAAHHGQGRPSIRTDNCPDAPPSLLTERAADVSLRFARLQQRWGPWGLAWWEALLRSVDQKASKQNLLESDALVEALRG